MKYVQVVLGSIPGGIEILIPNIVIQLGKDDCCIFEIYNKCSKDRGVFAGYDFSIVKGSDAFVPAFIKLFCFARKNSGAVFHGYNIGPIFLVALRLAGVGQIVYSIHGTKYWRNALQKAIRWPLWILAIKGARNLDFIANTEYSKRKFIEQVCHKAAPMVVYNPINTEKFFYVREFYTGLPKRISYAGRLNVGKNLKLWLCVAAKLKERLPDVMFDIWGDGPQKEELVRQVQGLGLQDCVVFHGYTSEIESTYRRSDLFLFLSEYESFGNVVVESILAGTPVLCADIPSMREIFRDYPEFLLDKSQDFANQVVSKLINYDKLVNQTQSAQKEFVCRYSIENHIGQLRRVYKEG